MHGGPGGPGGPGGGHGPGMGGHMGRGPMEPWPRRRYYPRRGCASPGCGGCLAPFVFIIIVGIFLVGAVI